MTLNRDIMVALHRGKITPRQAFAMQAEHEANLAAGNYRPEADTLAPYMTDDPPPLARTTEADWIMEVPRIVNVGSAMLREMLAAHERTVEARTDLGPCQKNAMRGVILRAWRASDEYPDEVPVETLQTPQFHGTVPVVDVDAPHTTHSGAGMR